MEPTIEIRNKLQAIQCTLSAPKNQYNNFGKYAYRSLEDITEAVKPLLAHARLALVIDDQIVMIGDRYYVKATVCLMGGDASISATAYAREPLSRKGMDESQITGAASSYARKYAMNGLFAIDDTKDADSDAPPKADAKKKQTARKPDTSQGDVPNEIVELAFKEFKEFRKMALPDGFHYSLPIFYQVVEKKFAHLPDTSDKNLDIPKCVAHIIKGITAKEILEQDKA